VNEKKRRGLELALLDGGMKSKKRIRLEAQKGDVMSEANAAVWVHTEHLPLLERLTSNQRSTCGLYVYTCLESQ
jgi:hypothetical protein